MWSTTFPTLTPKAHCQKLAIRAATRKTAARTVVMVATVTVTVVMAALTPDIPDIPDIFEKKD